MTTSNASAREDSISCAMHRIRATTVSCTAEVGRRRGSLVTLLLLDLRRSHIDNGSRRRICDCVAAEVWQARTECERHGWKD